MSAEDQFDDLDFAFKKLTDIEDEDSRFEWLHVAAIRFNALDGQEAVEVSQDSGFSREMVASELRSFLLCALIAKIEVDILKASADAVSHRNDAGSTDLTKVPGELRKSLEAMTKELDYIVGYGNQAGVIAEIGIHELGATLPGRAVPWWSGGALDYWPWYVPR